MERIRFLAASLIQRRRDDREIARFFAIALRLLHFNRIDGDVIEFGCARFHQVPLAWRAIRSQPTQRQIWAMGSFEPLPAARTARDLHPRYLAGTATISEGMFRRRCRLAGLPTQACHISRIDLTALDPSITAPARIALANISCQQFSAVRAVLCWLEPKLTHGMILAFEHYFCFSRFDRSGARHGLEELKMLRPDLNFVPYRTFAQAGQSFVVEDA